MNEPTQMKPCGMCEGDCTSPRECKHLNPPEPPDFNDEDFLDGEEDNFEPCTHCDQPDACCDFGCAIKQGLKRNFTPDGIF